MAEDSPATKQVTCLPARGEILPMGTQTVTVDFLPTNIMRYDFNLLLDMPGIQEGAARLPLTAECAVPLVALEEPQLSFGKCFLGYPYQQQFRLINESRLPAQFEVLPQVSLRHSVLLPPMNACHYNPRQNGTPGIMSGSHAPRAGDLCCNPCTMLLLLRTGPIEPVPGCIRG
jgi:hypothetical protein